MNRLTSLLAIAVLLAAAAPWAQAQNRKGSASRRAGRRTVAKPKAAAQPSQLATTTPSGLTYIITRKGTGKQPRAGDTVVVHYTGLLTSGAKFDSSLDGGQPIEFPLGRGKVIKGWDEALALLHVGDQATLIIPPQIGYGERGAGGGIIPPNATLIFVVELVDVKEAAPAGNN